MPMIEPVLIIHSGAPTYVTIELRAFDDATEQEALIDFGVWSYTRAARELARHLSARGLVEMVGLEAHARIVSRPAPATIVTEGRRLSVLVREGADLAQYRQHLASYPYSFADFGTGDVDVRVISDAELAAVLLDETAYVHLSFTTDPGVLEGE